MNYTWTGSNVRQKRLFRVGNPSLPLVAFGDSCVPFSGNASPFLSGTIMANGSQWGELPEPPKPESSGEGGVVIHPSVEA